MILRKNIQLAEMHADGKEVSLLITKLVFKVEKNQVLEGTVKNPIAYEDFQ
jgi:hypothetical protein